MEKPTFNKEYEQGLIRVYKTGAQIYKLLASGKSLTEVVEETGYTIEEVAIIKEVLLTSEDDLPVRIERAGRNIKVQVTDDCEETLNFKNCLCCGHPTLKTEIHDICDDCWWQDDPVCWNDIDDDENANGISLRQARINYEKYGNCDGNVEE